LANVTLLHAIYNLDELNYLRGGAWVYLHSQSECGTAPSLVEAICLGLPIVSYDVPANRETTENLAIYFSSVPALQTVVRQLDEKSVATMCEALAELAAREYSWKHINEQYVSLFEK
jgi:glycosyltransferase involved in cell wall biosynthesis